MQSALNEPTLVLNRHWVPIEVTTVRSALVMVYQRDAFVLAIEDFTLHGFDAWSRRPTPAETLGVGTVRGTILPPEIIVLARYAGLPRPPRSFSKKFLYQRDDNTCQYCGTRPGPAGLTIDHIVPRSRGGRSSWTNCAVACERCNGIKGDRTLAEAGMRMLRAPKAPDWSPWLRVPRQRRRPSWSVFDGSQRTGPAARKTERIPT